MAHRSYVPNMKLTGVLAHISEQKLFFALVPCNLPVYQICLVKFCPPDFLPSQFHEKGGKMILSEALNQIVTKFGVHHL